MTTPKPSGEDKEIWYGANAQVNSDPLVDSGRGTPVIMRFFEYAPSPEMKKLRPSSQEIFNAHAQQIRVTLWKDGLEPYQAIEPRIIHSKDKYRIMITCIPKAGVILNDKTQTLQDLIKPNV